MLTTAGAVLSQTQSIQASEERPLRILAAASLTGPLTSARDVMPGVQMVFGSSGLLARQIAAGAPADIYISADPQWIDWLVSKRPELVDREKRIFARNRLVVIGPRAQGDGPSEQGSATFPEALSAIPEDRPIAIGDPNHVPAGRYAKQALQFAGLWEALQGRLLYAANVRAALAYVESGAVPAGIVYASDARQSAEVVPIADIDPTTHDPIAYVMMRLSDRPIAVDLFETLGGGEIADRLSRFGFLPAADPPS